jgi:signal transduction histidine kinase
MSTLRKRAMIALAISGVLSLVPLVLVRAEILAAAGLGVGMALAIAASLISERPRAFVRSDRLRNAQSRLEQRIVKRREEALRSRRLVEGTARDRQEFSAAVSHELRTPLNSILGFAQVLLSEIEGPLSPSQREDVDAIQAAGVYLKDLVDEVLDSSSSHTETTPQLQPLDIATIVREVGRLLGAHQRRDRTLMLDIEIEPELPRVVADPRRVRQILLNLAGNALKFTRTGTVRIRAFHVSNTMRVAVEDTGPGIPTNDLSRIFRAFERVNVEEGQSEGWGLGLAIAREMAEWHGGRIDVATEIGRGSTFTLILPLSSESTPIVYSMERTSP